MDISDIVYEYSKRGGRSRGGWGGSKKFDIFLVGEEEAALTTREARERIRAVLPVKAGVTFKIASSSGHGGGRFGISMEDHG